MSRDVFSGRKRRINPNHRYLIKRNIDQVFVASTDDLGVLLPDAHCVIDTVGEDGLGMADGRCGIPDFLGSK